MVRIRASVLHVGKYYPPHMGGIESHVQQLVSRHSGQFDVTVAVSNDSWRTERELRDGATILRVGCYGSIASMPLTPTFPWAIRGSDPDLVHLHTPNPGGAFAVVANGLTHRLIITHHADTLGRRALRKLAHPFVAECMKRASAIIVTSRRYLETSEELAPYRHKCRVIPLGIDLPHSDSASAGPPETNAAPTILAVGRLVPYKGFDVLIRAMKSVNARLLLIGTGPSAAQLHQLAEGLGVNEKISFLGHVPDLQPYLKAASLFVLPSVSRAEAFGIVQAEAMAAGLPVVNTDIDSGVPEVSVDGETGLTVPPGDAAALSGAIQYLLDREDARREFGRRARARACAEFSADLMAARTLALYREVLQSRISPR